MNPLITYLIENFELQMEDAKIISGYFSKRLVKKKEVILKQGDLCLFEAFVSEGCLKTYYIDQSGNEVVLGFAVENWWVSDLVSFHERTPSHFYIESIESCELLVLTPEKKEELLKAFPILERVFRILIQKHLGSYQERIYNDHALSAEERYDIFMDRHSDIAQRVPQYLIASYLGISPESLSRIRKRKMQ